MWAIMADVGELDVGHHEGLSGESSQNVRKNIALHLKTGSTKSRRGRKPGRPKKEERLPPPEAADMEEEVQLPPMKGPPEPVHRNKKLSWDHKVSLVGRRHMDPHIHCCEHCEIPILIYGRVIPCKHVFCLDCAKKADKTCMRCGDPVQRIEQAALGTVFICTHGGAKHGVSGCRRTYLSSRDLQAHVQYRHAKDDARAASRSSSAAASLVAAAVPGQRAEYVVTSQAPIAGVAMLSPSGQQQQPGVLQQMPQQLQPQYVDGMHVLGQSYSAPPPVVVQQQQTYSQPPQQGAGMESYHTMSAVATQQQQALGHPANLISIPIQQEQLAQQGGFDARVPPPQIAPAPPGAVNYAQIQTGVVPQQQSRGGYPPASFSSTMPPPHLNAPQQQPQQQQQASIVHMSRVGAVPPSSTHLNPNPRGGAGGAQIVTAGMPPRAAHTPVSSHSGMPPRGGPPQRFPPNQQSYAQQPGGHWQGQGGPPPSMGHRPRTSSGAPPRY